MAKILVTGALGVIGGVLVPRLKKEGHDVVSTDLQVQDYMDYISADITSFEHLYRIFKLEKPEKVIHMAARVGRMMGEKFPQKMLSVNCMGTLNLIKLCLDYNCQLFSFSTSEVYGRLFDSGDYLKEGNLTNCDPLSVETNIYALSKLVGEALVKHYVENYGLNAIVVRPFMVYGPGEYPSQYRSALSNFIYTALVGGTIEVHDGSLRAWCYISDFVDGLLRLMRYWHLRRPEEYQAYNLGSEEYYPMKDIAKLVTTVCGGGTFKVVPPPSKFITLVKKFSIEKMKALGYLPKVSLEDGIRRVVEWQKEEMRMGRISEGSSDKFA